MLSYIFISSIFKLLFHYSLIMLSCPSTLLLYELSLPLSEIARPRVFLGIKNDFREPIMPKVQARRMTNLVLEPRVQES